MPVVVSLMVVEAVVVKASEVGEYQCHCGGIGGG